MSLRGLLVTLWMVFNKNMISARGVARFLNSCRPVVITPNRNACIER